MHPATGGTGAAMRARAGPPRNPPATASRRRAPVEHEAMSDQADTNEILLEAGTNEVEILVFRLGDRTFGVNVAKVREVIQVVPSIDVPHKHPSVVGFIEVREHVMTLIDLARHLGLRDVAAEEAGIDPAQQSIVITEFNDVRLGFLIDAVDRIHRVSWKDVRPVPATAVGDTSKIGGGGCTTGVVTLPDALVLLVDFESVADAILDERRMHVEHVENTTDLDRSSKRVVIAEDSPFVRTQMEKVMRQSGYSNVLIHADGAAAWAAIEQDEGTIDLVVSDIEMPQMDGLHLTRRIRQHPKHGSVPIVLFSSLISDDNRRKGKAVGANFQIPKPDLPGLVTLVDEVLSGTFNGQSRYAA